MIDKNLFSLDRKPPPPESAASTSRAGGAGMPVSNIQLDGVMVNGNNRKALLRLKSQTGSTDKKKPRSPYVTVRENQQVGDFRVSKIEPKSISLEKDGQTFVINLFAPGKVLPPAAVPPPAQPPPGVEGNVPPGDGQAVMPQEGGGNAPPVPPGQQMPPNAGRPGRMDPSLMQPPPGQVAGQTPPEQPVQDVEVSDHGAAAEEEEQ
jgi:hypothetical protein